MSARRLLWPANTSAPAATYKVALDALLVVMVTVIQSFGLTLRPWIV
jgi:hypothetical protein